MKIQVTKSNYVTIVDKNHACGFSEVPIGETAILLGMGKAYRKLKNRINREGLFSLGFSGHSVSRLNLEFRR